MGAVNRMRRMGGLARCSDNLNRKEFLDEAKEQPRNRGVFYAKGGKGIESNPYSKRKPYDGYGLSKVKGKFKWSDPSFRRNVIRRERGKSEYREATLSPAYADIRAKIRM